MSEIAANVGSGVVELQFDEASYPKDAIYGSAYVFIDRCFVHLDRVGDGKVKVSLKAKSKGIDVAPFADEFRSELVGQAWRRELLEANRDLLWAITGSARRAEPETPSFDDLLGADDQSAFEDPLGIAMSWEDKFGNGEKSQ
jgi:His-Xaa-Ser system protein HxsD